jgi:hypothetical protein
MEYEMTKLSAPLTKHQVKTEATLRGLLDAAETIFVRDGYERAQIETIAAEAGRTKGAVYAQGGNLLRPIGEERQESK